MSFANFFFSPGVRGLSIIGGLFFGAGTAIFGTFSGYYQGAVWGILVGAGAALLLSLLLPLLFWWADTPYRKAKAQLPKPFLLDSPVRFSVPGGAVGGYFILTENSMVLLSFERGKQLMELGRDDVRSVTIEEGGAIRILLSDTKFVSFSAVEPEQIYQLLRRQGWNA